MTKGSIDNSHELSRLQEIELDILREIDRICSEQKIQYLLLGGSMLGAVRHSGFIPWDDDIDIGMLRNDYDRFLLLAENELRSPYELHTYQNCPSHHYYFSHVVDSRYQVRRMGSEDKRVEDVWVDIYPLDGLPANPVVRGTHCMRLLFFRFMYHFAHFDKVNVARSGRPMMQRIAIGILTPLHKVVKPDKNKWRDRIDKALRKFNPQDNPISFNFMDVYLFKELFPTELVRDLVLYPFEDMKVPGPRDFDKFLTRVFGDYMKLPPENEREAHPMEILFDEKKQNTERDASNNAEG